MGVGREFERWNFGSVLSPSSSHLTHPSLLHSHTGIYLIDESHVSAHCYSERGWLALDVFTCGKTDPSVIAEKLHERLTAAVPGLRMIRGMTLDRFLHLDMEG